MSLAELALITDDRNQGVQLRLKHELDIEIEDIVLVKVLLELESESNLSKMQFTSQTPEAIIDLIKENLELIEKYKKDMNSFVIAKNINTIY